MIGKSGAVFIACGLLALAADTPVHAQSADHVLCDRIAADPADPDKPADVKGVAEIAPSDIATAIKFCKTASGASRRAMYQLGRAYAASGQGPDAIAAFRKAADKGSTSAMAELGARLATGSGVAKDDAAARKLLERSAEAGNPRAIAALAASSGGGAPSDPAKARALLMKGADTNSEAQFQLGLMLANGVGGPQDSNAAKSYYERAAAQNHPGALEWMGSFSRSGRGGPQDSNAAKSYYERSAALGNENAKDVLKQLNCSMVVKDKRGNIIGHVC
jgi:TPR repeat protein